MNPEWETLKATVEILESLGMRYMLTGSLAKIYYSVPRMTRDIDIVIELEESDVAGLVAAFRGSYYIDSDTVSEALGRRSMFNVVHSKYLVKVDFIVRKGDTFRSLEFQRRKQVNLGELILWIVSPEDLIISKLFWAKDSLSELQLGDVRDLLKSVRGLDRAYIEEWVEKLGLRHVFERLST